MIDNGDIVLKKKGYQVPNVNNNPLPQHCDGGWILFMMEAKHRRMRRMLFEKEFMKHCMDDIFVGKAKPDRLVSNERWKINNLLLLHPLNLFSLKCSIPWKYLNQPVEDFYKLEEYMMVE
ncbi:hypothetical protein ACH5RR_029269 [Cinchona calisaya]|uniref:Cytochrome P450 n=1 Tax=Cinchona calisaya TaxID=153742 RepID=A0ABD2YWE4_9GENT